MEGSGSGSGSGFNKESGGEGLPATVPRSSRRRARDENNANEENPEVFVQANLQQPQPQQVEAAGQIEPADLRARLANRRYSETFRHKRQTHVQELEAQVAALEEQFAQAKTDYEIEMAERTENQAQIEALMKRHEAATANLLAQEVETERIRRKIERLEKKMEAANQKIEDIMINDPIYQFFDDTFTTLIDALAPPFPGNPPPRSPPRNPATGDDDEAGPSEANDSSDDSV